MKLGDDQYPDVPGAVQGAAGGPPPRSGGAHAAHPGLLRLSAPDAKADDAPLRDGLKALQDLDARTAAEIKKAYEGIDQVLDLRQQARFRVFEEQMERRKIELVTRARQNNRANNRPNAGRRGQP